MSLMPQINCYIPIKLRLVGELGEAQLEQLGQTLVRMLQARLAFAEQAIQVKHRDFSGSVAQNLLQVDYEPADKDSAPHTYQAPSYNRRADPTHTSIRQWNQ